MTILKRALDLLKSPQAESLKLSFVKRGGWLGKFDSSQVPYSPIHAQIERRAKLTNAAGARPLWEGYQSVKNYPRATHGTRTSDQVRTPASMGRVYSWIARSRGDPVVIEFGTAFGVSGMYWLAGIGQGHLYTFEPNVHWAELARENLKAISSRFTLTLDTFEAAGSALVQHASADIAFIDAIHTGEFVRRQYEVLKPLMRPGALVLFDDIGFSDDMQDCWREIARDTTLAASATLSDRVGIVELGN